MVVMVMNKKNNNKAKIVKTFKENRWGELYIEFTKREINAMGLESGDSVEWMQLEDGEVWKKVSKNKWSI